MAPQPTVASPVRWGNPAILADEGASQVFLEIGPHSALAAPLRQILRIATSSTDSIYISTMTRNTNDVQHQMLHTLRTVHINSGNVDLLPVNGEGNVLKDVPLYPWKHETRFWHESRLTREWRYRKFPHHELLGARVVESSDLEPSWRNLLRLEEVPWICDHVVQGQIVFPAAGYVAMAGEAVQQLSPRPGDYSYCPYILDARPSIRLLPEHRIRIGKLGVLD